MITSDVVIVGAARTPIGRYGGAFRNVHPAELGAVAVRAALERAGDRGVADVDEVLIGHARQAGSGPNPARQVGDRARASRRGAGADDQQGVRVGHAGDRVAARRRSCSASRTWSLAGGIESMSRMPYLVDAEDARWGHRMGNFTLVDAMYRDGFTCSLCGMIMGETAEVLAREYGITREASDAYALESQRSAQRRAIADGRFRERDRAGDDHGRERARAVARSRRTSIRGRDTTHRGAAKAAAGVPNVEGSRHHHRRHVVRDHRRRRGGGAASSAARAAARRPHAAGADHRLGERRRRSADHGHRPRAGDAEAAAAHRPRARRLRSRRAERSVRPAGARGACGTCRSRRRS